jgi:DNA-binding CsgD family transcriptional regulator
MCANCWSGYARSDGLQHSYRQIGQSLNVSLSTVQGYVKRAQRVG